MLEANAANRSGFFFCFAFAQRKDHRYLGMAVFADLVVDFLVTGVELNIQALGFESSFNLVRIVIRVIGNGADNCVNR